jgi:predicted small secreted protein
LYLTIFQTIVEYPMKKTIFILLSFLMMLTIAACGNVSAGVDQDVSGSDPAEERPLETPMETQLMLGTVKLEETDNAVNSVQASELLPLWKTLRSLVSSETAAQAEIDAVIAQIQDTMSDEQMMAIEEMGLTMQDFASVAETLGIDTGFAGRFGDMDPEKKATMEAMRESGEIPSGGEFPEGGFPGGGRGGGQGLGGGFGSGEEVDPEARETAMAERGGVRGAGFGINSSLLDAIIAFLEAKVQ